MTGKLASHSIIADSAINSALFSIFSGEGLVMEIIAKNRNLIKRGSVNTKIKVAISLDCIWRI
jgi:hypothetical protein